MQNEYLKYFSTGFDKMQQIQMEYYVFLQCFYAFVHGIKQNHFKADTEKPQRNQRLRCGLP